MCIGPGAIMRPKVRKVVFYRASNSNRVKIIPGCKITLVFLSILKLNSRYFNRKLL